MTIHVHNCTQENSQGLALSTDRAFFRCLRERGAMTRAAISQKTGISRPTISEAAQRLCSQSLIVETRREAVKRQGRAGLMYKINAAKGLSLGIALNGESLRIRVLDLAKNILCERVIVLEDFTLQSEFFDVIEKEVSEAIGGSSSPVLAVGVSVAAPVDSKTGKMITLPHSPFHVAHNINFPNFFSQKFHCPVVIDNDVNWATLAEKAEGNAVNEDNFAFFYFGRGIGAGIYIGGRLLRGATGMAGEVGYYQVNSDENLQDFVNSHHLAAALSRGEMLTDHPAMKSIVHVIHSVSIIVNPDVVVVGGPLARHSAFMESLTLAAEKCAFVPSRIIPSSMPETAPLSGASAGAYELALSSLGLQEPLE